jgi:hypothetical protein
MNYKAFQAGSKYFVEILFIVYVIYTLNFQLLHEKISYNPNFHHENKQEIIKFCIY